MDLVLVQHLVFSASAEKQGNFQVKFQKLVLTDVLEFRESFELRIHPVLQKVNLKIHQTFCIITINNTIVSV